VFIDNEFDVGDEVIGESLSNVNAIVEWLKMNQPANENEIDGLMRMISEFKINDDVWVGDYGIRDLYGHRMIFGPVNMLYVQGDEMVDYLLGLLDLLREESMVIEQDNVGVAA
jgi:hypothetical protein